MADMTLEQLRESIRGWEAQSHADRHKYAECRDSPSEGTFSDWADAIDAHIARMGEPAAWLHDDPKRIDVIHADVKQLLQDAHAAGTSPGHLLRRLDAEERYTIPLYSAPPSSGDWDKVREVIAELREAADGPGTTFVTDDNLIQLAEKLEAALSGSGK